MPKVFNVEQLRLNGRLLTGSAEGLFFDRDNNGAGEQLAQGTAAVPTDFELKAGAGLKFNVDGVDFDTVDLSETPREFYIKKDGSTLDITDDVLHVRDDGIGRDQLDPADIGAGLGVAQGIGGQGLYVKVEGSSPSLAITNDELHVKADGILADHIADDAVGDDQLDIITVANQIYGRVVYTDNDTVTFDNTVTEKPLMIKPAGVGKNEIDDEIAGDGLIGGNNGVDTATALSVNVDDASLEILGSGPLVNKVKIKNAGVDFNHMQLGTTANRLLGYTGVGVEIEELQVKTAMIEADAVTYNTMQDITVDHRLLGRDSNSDGTVAEIQLATDHVVDDAITYAKMQDTSVANRVLGAVSAGVIGEVQVSNAMLAGSITQGKLSAVTDKSTAQYISNDSAAAGNGLTLSAGILNVVGATDGGLTLSANEMAVDASVVRTTAGAQPLLEGDYSFKEIVTFLSGITVAGGLEVQGETFVTEANEVQIGDEIIVLNADYPGGNAPDAGIEINRGTQNTQNILFDDHGTNQWIIGKQGGEGIIHTEPRLQPDLANVGAVVQNRWEGVFSMSKQLPSGVSRESVLFSEHPNISAYANDTNELGRIPNVVVTLQNTGVAVNDPSSIDGDIQPFGDLLSVMVTKVNTTGFNIDFSSKIPASGTLSDYTVKAWISVDTNAEQPGSSYSHGNW